MHNVSIGARDFWAGLKLLVAAVAKRMGPRDLRCSAWIRRNMEKSYWSTWRLWGTGCPYSDSNPWATIVTPIFSVHVPIASSVHYFFFWQVVCWQHWAHFQGSCYKFLHDFPPTRILFSGKLWRELNWVNQSWRSLNLMTYSIIGALSLNQVHPTSWGGLSNSDSSLRQRGSCVPYVPYSTEV